jgi:hypothetical protein
MNIRQTSVNAYNFLKSSGALGELQWQTYDVLFRLGGLTANEIFVKVKEEMLAAGVAESEVRLLRDTYHQRLSELKALGLVYEVQERECTVTHRVVIEWDVTSNTVVAKVNKPIKISKGKHLEIQEQQLIEVKKLLKDLSTHFQTNKEITELIHYAINQMLEKLDKPTVEVA